jgi:hypothetical protein
LTGAVDGKGNNDGGEGGVVDCGISLAVLEVEEVAYGERSFTARSHA